MTNKTFVIYTSTADPTKVLRNGVQVVLTVTPPVQAAKAIVWKMYDFLPRSDTTQTATWVSQPGFGVVGSDEVQASIACNVGDAVVYDTSHGFVPGNTLTPKVSGVADNVSVKNASTTPQTFNVGTMSDTDVFTSLLRLPVVAPNGTSHGRPATLLQAYGVPPKSYDFTGKDLLLKDADQQKFIFRTSDATPKPSPIDLTKLSDNTTYLLYSTISGELVLEDTT
ncbi:unnamed protein product [Somion occarium]|uniref:Uncharacterized protein n=1 Tax=Somion occarium TaxID=3059160 RepID=A0ABP1CMM0_9APHY